MWKVCKTPRLCIDLGGRQVEKIAHCFEKIRRFVHWFFIQNWWKFKPGSEKNEFREKNRLKIASWRPFGGQGSIFGRFWDPGGNPKIAKKLRVCRGNGVWGALVWKNRLKMAPRPHFSKFWHQIWHWQGSKFKKTRPGGMRAALKCRTPARRARCLP